MYGKCQAARTVVWNVFLLIVTKRFVEQPLYFLREEFWLSPWQIFLFAGSLFAIVLLRYLVFAIVYNSVLQRFIGRKRVRISQSNRKQWQREIAWSACSSLIFAVLTTVTYWLYTNGYTRIYSGIEDRSYGYFIFTIVLLLVLYETYYYWLHRWMHLPKIYKIVHKVHHDSVHTSVFTSFSFHPLEAVLQFIFLPAMLLIIPVHYYALAIVLMLMTFSAIINHAGIEVFPRRFNKHFLGRWLIGATHHDLHHKTFRANFGLYFTFWDKWMQTESNKFDEQFEKNTRSVTVNQSRSPHRQSTDGLHT